MTGKIMVDAKNKGVKMGDMFGIFFEDLNHAADGGLYPEMVQNRAFEFCAIDNRNYNALTAWNTRGEIEVSVLTDEPYSAKNPHYIYAKGSGVVTNEGFTGGFYIEKDKIYDFSCLAKGRGKVTAGLEFDDESCAIGDFEPTGEWKRFSFEFEAPEKKNGGKLTLNIEGEVCFDFVSFFPRDTFNNRKNGLRRDLARMLKDLKPRFMRFPGGCLVHDGALDRDARDALYHWKNSVGELENRAARRNNWGYNQTLGLGYYEYFLLCEDIGAEPLPVLAGGYNPHSDAAVPMDEMDEWVQDALDLIEFANGLPDTKWGGLRAKLGHEKPFDLKYIAIGNEEVNPEFFERYPLYHKAIKEKYPEIQIINSASPFCAGEEYERGWASARENKSDLIDEHYYQSPDWYLANIDRYDDFKADEPHVFLGEYASKGNTWYNALCEAAYMTALQNNARAVALACYAPLFANVNYVNWRPDMIYFDNSRAFGSANYYVQQLFMHHQGENLLDAKVEGLSAEKYSNRDTRGKIVFMSHEDVADYTDITLTNEDSGEVTRFSDVTVTPEKRAECVGSADCDNYTLRFTATEREGFKGFIIRFGVKDERNDLEWSIGGWANYDSTINGHTDGYDFNLEQASIHVKKEHAYKCELRVRGRKIEAFIDGKKFHGTEFREVNLRPLYVTAASEGEDVIIKVANVQSVSVSCTVDTGLSGRIGGKIYEMAGFDRRDENSFDEPKKVSPKERGFSADAQFDYTFPPYSFTVFRVRQ